MEEELTYRKIYIKSADDLPKETGNYFGCNKLIDSHYKIAYRKVDSAWWLENVDWYLQPIKEITDSDIWQEAQSARVHGWTPEQYRLYQEGFFDGAKWRDGLITGTGKSKDAIIQKQEEMLIKAIELIKYITGKYHIYDATGHCNDEIESLKKLESELAELKKD